MYCVSISYKSADINIRKTLAFSEEKRAELIHRLLKQNTVSQCVVLCTCNRTEIYFCGEKGCEKEVVSLIAGHAGVEPELLSKHILLYFGDGAVNHLFKVSSGIDSMVIGEDEILGQTKNAYLLSCKLNAAGYELNMIFQAAFACAKKIKTETALSKSSSSVATLAASEAAKFGKNILVIGASGKIGTTVLKNLLSRKNITVKATLRKHNSRLRLFEDTGVELVDYKKRYEYINEADCVISATLSPHYTVTAYDCKKNTDGRERLFIDLAVPPDIESSVAKLDGARLFNIDYFEELAKRNNKIKMDSVDAAEEIIKSETNVLKKDILFHDFLPFVSDVKEYFKERPLEELIYRMKSDTDSRTFSEFIEILKTFGE